MSARVGGSSLTTNGSGGGHYMDGIDGQMLYGGRTENELSKLVVCEWNALGFISMKDNHGILQRRATTAMTLVFEEVVGLIAVANDRIQGI